MPNDSRLVSIAHPLRHPRVDNHSIFNAPALFDYDVITVDPGGVFEAVNDVIEARAAHYTHADTPVANGESTATHAGLADVLRRRQNEVVRALERGALIVVFTYPQATITEVSTFSGLDRYFFLPAPPGLGWDSRLLQGGEGSAIAVTDHAHPFARVIDVLRQDVRYRAHFDDRAPGFAGNARILARSSGGAPVAAEFTVGGGRVVFLPAPRETGGHLSPALASAILEATDTMLGRAQGAPPLWLANVAVAGLPARDAAVERARDALGAAERALQAAEASQAELAVLRDVLWTERPRALAVAVERCLALLGFEAAGDGHVHAPEGDLLLEVAGAEGEVGMGPHYALRARLESVIEHEHRAPRGLVVANGQRLLPPEDRESTFDESLRIGAEAMRYALITAPELFFTASAALEGGLPAETLANIRLRMLTTDGLVELDDLVTGAAAGAPPAGASSAT